MIEPNRNDRCNDLPRTIGCTGSRADNTPDARIRLDAVKSAAIMRIARKATDEGTIINWGALGAALRLTCWT